MISLNLNKKNCLSCYHLVILTVSKYYRFYDKIPPWQPEMHGQPLYNVNLIIRTGRCLGWVRFPETTLWDKYAQVYGFLISL